MPNIREIKRRIVGAQNTAKITGAMELIAAMKMRRAQAHVLAGRPYAERLRAVFASLARERRLDEVDHPLLRRHIDAENVGLVQIAPDRGLAGALPGNLNRRTGAFIVEQQAQGVRVKVTAVGRKGRDFIVHSGQELRAEFTRLPDFPAVADLGPIVQLMIDDYGAGLVDAVYVVYTEFVSTVAQRPVVERLLPIEPEGETEDPRGPTPEYLFEPSPEALLGAIVPRYLEMTLYHAVLEAIASEQSARMVSMRNATDNARDMIQDLTLTYNKARQEMITTELLDIAGAAAAIQ